MFLQRRSDNKGLKIIQDSSTKFIYIVKIFENNTYNMIFIFEKIFENASSCLLLNLPFLCFLFNEFNHQSHILSIRFSFPITKKTQNIRPVILLKSHHSIISSQKVIFAISFKCFVKIQIGIWWWDKFLIKITLWDKTFCGKLNIALSTYFNRYLSKVHKYIKFNEKI